MSSNSVFDSGSYDIRFVSIAEKKFFADTSNFFCVGFAELETAIKSELPGRSSSNKCRSIRFWIPFRVASVSFRFMKKNFSAEIFLSLGFSILKRR